MVTMLDHPVGPSNILVVDNDRVDRRFYSLVLEPFEFHSNIYVADEGRTALSFLSQMGGAGSDGAMSLIIFDLDLPDMGGLAFIRSVREEIGLSGATLVAATNATNPLRLSQAKAKGADFVVSKDRFFRQFETVYAEIQAHLMSVVAAKEAVPQGEALAAF